MKHFLYASTALALSCSFALADTLIKDISYGDKVRNSLDLYLPDTVETPPLVVFIHGGRWYRNDKSQVELYGRIDALMEAGIAIAAIDYAYSSQEIWPAQLDDVLNAFAFLRENEADYDYDSNRLAVWGQSSGAHMALWAGLKLAEDPETTLDAVVSWYAPSGLYEITQDRVDDAVKGENERFPEPSPESLLIGADARGSKDLADAASPTNYASGLEQGKSLPDFLLIHGDADFVISPLQSQRMHDILAAQGGADSLTLRFIEGARHGGDGFEAETPRSIEFLQAQFESEN